MKAIILIEFIEEKEKLQEFLKILNQLRILEVYIKDIHFFQYFQKNETSFKTRYLKQDFKHLFEEYDKLLIINSDLMDIKAAILLIKYSREKSVSALIYYKEGLENKNAVSIDENYNAAEYKFYEESPEAFISSEIYFTDTKFIRAVYQNIDSYDELFPFFMKNKETLGQVYCIPYNNCENTKETGNQRKIAFIDRDGIIIKDEGFTHKEEHIKISDGIIPFLHKLKNYGYEFIIITNQSGIARGKFKLRDFIKFQKILIKNLEKEGVKILDSFYCPFLNKAEVAKYRRDSLLRKPMPGMILKALSKYNINIYDSFMIGDKESDMIQLPYLSSYLMQGNYNIDKKFKVHKNLDELFQTINKEKINL